MRQKVKEFFEELAVLLKKYENEIDIDYLSQTKLDFRDPVTNYFYDYIASTGRIFSDDCPELERYINEKGKVVENERKN